MGAKMLSRRLAVAGAMLMPATALAQTDGCDYPPDAVKRVNHFSNILMDALKKGGYETDKQGAWAGIGNLIGELVKTEPDPERIMADIVDAARCALQSPMPINNSTNTAPLIHS
jgi:hypothetical protein